MLYVIQRKKDGAFLKGRTRWRVEWVTDLQLARTYTRRGDVSNSINNGLCPVGDEVEVIRVKLAVAAD